MTDRPTPAAPPVEWRWSVALFLVALVVRAIHVRSMQKGPYFFYPVMDAFTYREQAIAVASGHGHPDVVFYQPPGYSYFLAALYSLWPGAYAPRVVQCVLGAGCAVLTQRLGSRYFGAWVGIASGFAVALYGLLIWFDGELLTPTLALFLLLSAMLLAAHAAEAKDSRLWGLSGFVIGLACTVTGTFPFVMLALAPFARRRAPIFLLAAALAISPVTLRNRIHGGEWVPLSYNAGLAFFVGNNAHADETSAARSAAAWRRINSPPEASALHSYSATSANYFRHSLRFARAFPGQYVALQFRKALQFIGGNEIPRNQQIYTARQTSWILWLLLWKIPGLAFPYGLVFPLALAGLVFRCKRALPLAVAVTTLSLLTIAFFVTARYRSPAIPFFCIFAAEGVRWFWQEARARQRVLFGAILLPALLASNLNQGPMATTEFPDTEILRAYQLNLEGKAPAAVEALTPVVEHDPKNGEAWTELGVSRSALGQFPQAAQAFQRGLSLWPEDERAMMGLGLARERLGDPVAARALYERTLKLDPNNAFARARLAQLQAGPR